MDLKSLTEKAATARHRSAEATTTQERLRWEGMARYWQELIDEHMKATLSGQGGQADGNG